MKISRIQVGSSSDIKLIVSDISLFGNKSVEIVNGWDEENKENNFPSTLKDISIIMEWMVGIGVTWQLANELSERLKINNPALISDILFDIFKEYSSLSDEDAFKRHEESPKLYDPLV